jgi:hypothetical protein
MSGSIEEIPLPDLLQLLSTSRKSGVLVLRSADFCWRKGLSPPPNNSAAETAISCMTRLRPSTRDPKARTRAASQPAA